MPKVVQTVVALLAVAALSRAVQVPVSMIDNTFVPDSLIINPGDSVVWTNNGINPHTSTSGVNGVPDGLWNSGTLANGASYVHGFPSSGNFHYYCQFHYFVGMTGVVVVGTSGASELPAENPASPGVTGYPNPFRSSVTLRLASAREWQRVRIFDSSGKLVRTLGARHGGSVVWDGRNNRGEDAGPGVYFCRYGSRELAVTRLR